MRSLTRALALAAAPLLLAAAPGAAHACSVVADYRVPTNLELAAEANAIVIGEVAGAAEALAEPGEALSAAIEVRPLAMLKGLTPGGALLLPGMALAPADAAAPEPGEPDFAQPHPEALAGACIRRTFQRDATVLFFLDRREGDWVPAGGPFTRWAEDVANEDAPWVQLARFYARVAPLDETQRTALLEAERDALLARADDPAAQAMAADLDRTLAEPPPSAVAAAPPEPEDDGFYKPGEVSAVQRALDAMRADGPAPR